MPPCAVEFVTRFAEGVRDLPAEKRLEIEEGLRRLSQTFGQPHLHTGLGIRRLQRNYFFGSTGTAGAGLAAADATGAGCQK